MEKPRYDMAPISDQKDTVKQKIVHKNAYDIDMIVWQPFTYSLLMVDYILYNYICSI